MAVACHRNCRTGSPSPTSPPVPSGTGLGPCHRQEDHGGAWWQRLILRNRAGRRRLGRAGLPDRAGSERHGGRRAAIIANASVPSARTMAKSRMNAEILIVDDERAVRQAIAAILGDEGYSVRQARRAARGAAPRSRRGRRAWCCSTSGWRARKLDGLRGARSDQADPPRGAGDRDQRPRHDRDRGQRRSRRAPTTSSRSRSTPTGCCC